MIKELHETEIVILAKRLLTIEEFEEFEEDLPPLPNSHAWWLADTDDDEYVAYAEGNYREDGFFCASDETNTYLRVALDIVNGEPGKEFVYFGVVFTALSESVAISNNFVGMAKYYDEELLSYFIDDSVSCTIDAIINDIFDDLVFNDVEDNDDNYFSLDDVEESEEDDNNYFSLSDVEEIEEEDDNCFSLADIEESDEESETVSCRRCHYYDMCDEKDDNTKYCPSFRVKK